MDRETLRLELVKLTYAHGRDAAEAVGRAKDLEAYVSEPAPKPADTTLKLPQKTAGQAK